MSVSSTFDRRLHAGPLLEDEGAEVAGGKNPATAWIVPLQNPLKKWCQSWPTVRGISTQWIDFAMGDQTYHFIASLNPGLLINKINI